MMSIRCNQKYHNKLMDKMYQIYPINQCNNGKIKGFKTNKGKYVRLEMISGDEIISIYVRSFGKYRIKIRYTYNLFESKMSHVIKIKAGKKYREKEEDVEYNQSINLYTDGSATIIFDDESEIFGETYNDELIRPSDIEILNIEKIG